MYYDIDPCIHEFNNHLISLARNFVIFTTIEMFVDTGIRGFKIICRITQMG